MFFEKFKIFVDKIIDYYSKEKANKGLWLVVIFASGIGYYFSLFNEPSKWIGIVILETIVMLAVLCRYRPYLLSLIGICGIFTFGFFVAQMRAQAVKAPVFNQKSYSRYVNGRVVSVEEGAGKRGQRVILDDLYIDRIDAEKTPEKIRIVLTPKSEKVKYGDKISVKAMLNRPFFPAMAGANNFARMAWFQQIGAVGYAVSRVKIVKENKSNFSNINFLIGNLRMKMSERVRNILPEDNGTIAIALISGERGDIPRYLIDAYRDSGLAHFLSISGLHMGLVGGFAFFLIRFCLAFFPRIALAYDTKKWAAVFGIFTTTCYLIVSGFRIPAERAYIMTSIMFVAILVNRRAISMRLIGFAGFLVLMFHPEALVSPSFQMSFAAVIALVALYEAVNIRSFLPKPDKKRSLIVNAPKMFLIYIIGVLTADFVASVATLPFAIFHFNRVAIYTLLGNLLSAPIICFMVMPFIVFSLVLMPFGLEYPAVKVAGLGINFINKIVLWVSDFPNASVLVKAMPVPSLIFIVFGMLWLCFWKERWRYYGLLLVIFGIGLHFLAKTPDVIAGENGNLIAFKLTDNQMALSSSKMNFVGKVWFERAGISPKEAKRNHKYWEPSNNVLEQNSNPNMTCDYYGCVYSKNGVRISILKQIDDVKIDCDKADLIISPFSLEYICSETEVIDYWDFRNNGNYSIFISSDGNIKIENVMSKVGNRLWSD